MLSINNQNKAIYSSAVLKKIKNSPDFFIYMFSHFFLNPVDLQIMYKATKTPILFWLMDSEAMTGGCHFTWQCEKYINTCGNCPGLNSHLKNDQSFVNLINKNKVFQSVNIQPVYATEHQRQMLSKSLVFKNKESHKVYIPVDEYKYFNEREVRKKHNLPNDKKLIFFAASQIDDERKGMSILNNALNILVDRLTEVEKNELILVIAGHRFDKLEVEWSFNYVHLGYLSQYDFAKIMNCCDLFICPSIEDSGPMVINQALMSGTPVVAFEMGIAKDFIKNGITGYIAKLGDQNDLANGIYSLLHLSDSELLSMSENCRKIALENFSSKAIVSQFNEIFKNLLSKTKSKYVN